MGHSGDTDTHTAHPRTGERLTGDTAGTTGVALLGRCGTRERGMLRITQGSGHLGSLGSLVL